MTEFNRIEDVDAFCLKLYSGDKKATLKVTSEGWRRIIDEIGIGLLLAVLQHSTSAYSIMFVSRAASECLETIFGDADQLTQFTTSVYDLLCARDAELNAAARLALRQLVCVAVQRGYRYSPTLAQMASSVCASCASLINNETERDRLRVGCEVLADLVLTLNEHRMATFASDVSIAKAFRDDHLLGVYRLAVEIIKQVPPRCRSNVAAALRLAQRVLDFDFACDSGLFDGDENPVTRTYPDAWTPYLLDVAFVDRLWTLYRVPDWEAEVSQSVLEVLAALVSLRKAMFLDAAVRQEWCGVILLQTQLVMECYTHLEEEETLSVFARLLNRIKPNCEMDELMQQSVFPRWLHSLRSFTRQCFANWRHASTALLSLLSTWARLMEARSYATQDTTGMAQAALEVVRDYIDCIHSRVRVFTTELGRLMSGDGVLPPTSSRLMANNMPVEYMLDDDREGVRLETEFLLKIVSGCGEDAWDALEATAQDVGQTVLTQLRRGPGELSADHVVAIEEGAWSLHLLHATLLSSGAVDQGAPHTLAMLLHSLMQLKQYTAGAASLDQLPSAVRGHFSSGAVEALGTVLAKTVSVYVHSNRKTSAFVEQLNLRLRQCEEMEATGTFGVYFLNLAVYTLWAILNTANVPDEVRIEALVLLDEWTSTPSVLRILKETQAYKLVMNLAPEAYPAPLRHTGAFAARYLFVRCVAQVLFLDSTAFTDSAVTALMEPLLARVNAALYPAARPAPDAHAQLALALCDLRGVLSCTERRPYRIVMDMVEPVLYALADAALREEECNQLAVVQLLELVNELALNKSQRIMYSAQSARPVLIFRYASHVVVRCARLASLALESSGAAAAAPLHHDAQSPVVEWGWKVARLTLTVACNIIQGGWCNLGVLQLYDDAALVNALDSAWRLLSTLPQRELAVRPKVCAAVVKMVSALATRFFHWYWVKQPPAEVAAVVGFVEALAFPAALGAVETAQQSDALQALDRLVNCCWVRTAYPAEEAQQAATMKATLLQADALVFHRVATCALERSVAADNHAVRKLLPSLFYVEGAALDEVGRYFSTRGTTPAAAEALRRQFAEIQRQVASTPDITNETMNELQNSLHTLMDTLKVSL